MPLHRHDRQLDIDGEIRVTSRRAVLRRSALRVAGVGLTLLLTACGGEDEPVEGPVVDEPAEDEIIQDEEILDDEGATTEPGG